MSKQWKTISRFIVDLVLVFLPQSDRAKDDSDGDSIYAWVYRRLLRRRVASQVIYEKTLRKQSRFVYQQIVPIPLFGTDRIAYRRLQGIYPGELEGNKQYWL